MFVDRKKKSIFMVMVMKLLFKNFIKKIVLIFYIFNPLGFLKMYMKNKLFFRIHLAS